MDVKHLLYIYVIAMAPVIELRGAIPVGLGLGLPFPVVFIAAFLGNITPVPFLILFTRNIFSWLRKKSERLSRFVSRLEGKAEKHRDTINKYALFGLCLLVAIPLPGTGAWTGSLVAAVFEMRLKKSFPAIALGVLIAGIIVSAISYGVKAMV